MSDVSLSCLGAGRAGGAQQFSSQAASATLDQHFSLSLPQHRGGQSDTTVIKGSESSEQTRPNVSSPPPPSKTRFLPGNSLFLLSAWLREICEGILSSRDSSLLKHSTFCPICHLSQTQEPFFVLRVSLCNHLRALFSWPSLSLVHGALLQPRAGSWIQEHCCSALDSSCFSVFGWGFVCLGLCF